MAARVSATRMELLRHRRRLAMARRGHRLLKDKQDELVRRFFTILEEYFGLRRRLDAGIGELRRRGVAARRESGVGDLRSALWPPPPPAQLETRMENLLGIRVPRHAVRLPGEESTHSPYQLSSSYDDLAAQWRRFLPLLAETAGTERTLRLLAGEIESTRRRVNALEFRLVPALEEGIRTITLKLAENELGTLTRLMRVKEAVRGH